MGNKKVLSKATRELNKTKRFAVPKNIIEDPRGQWAYPGEITRIPSDTITMQGVPYPVMAYPNMGEPQMMYPGQEYYFPGADYVDEYPEFKEGGAYYDDARDAWVYPDGTVGPNGPAYCQEGGMTTPLDLDPKTMKKYKEFLKVQENSIKAGYNASQDKWYPHTSPEGGKKTIAYGHKLQGSDASKYAKGITTAQANELLNRDILKHQAIAEAEVDSKYGKGTFDSLPQQSQMLLVDYAYNLGTLNEFPKFVNGVVTGNKQQMLAEHTRYFNGDQPLEQRNAWVVDTIQGKNSQSSTPTALKKTPVPSTTKKQSSDGTRDQWGRSQATIWYGFNPKTKQYDQDGLIWEQYGDPGPGIEGPGKGAYVTPGERLRLYEEGLKKNKYSDGGIVLELSDSEIEEYRKGGWIVEEM